MSAGVRKAGRVGPRRMLRTPSAISVSSTATAFCSNQEITSDSGNSLTPQLKAPASAVAMAIAE